MSTAYDADRRKIMSVEQRECTQNVEMYRKRIRQTLRAGVLHLQ